LLRAGRQRYGQSLLSVVVISALIIGFLPPEEWLFCPLERRFATSPVLPERVDGILVPGSTVDAVRSLQWQQVETNRTAERLQAFATLARRYAKARLLFTGGSGRLGGQAYKESDVITRS